VPPLETKEALMPVIPVVEKGLIKFAALTTKVSIVVKVVEIPIVTEFAVMEHEVIVKEDDV